MNVQILPVTTYHLMKVSNKNPSRYRRIERYLSLSFLKKKKKFDSVQLLRNRIIKESLSVFNFAGFMRNTKRSKVKEKMNNSTIDMVSVGELS